MTIDEGLLAQGLVLAFIAAASIGVSASIPEPWRGRITVLAIVLTPVAILSVLGAIWTAVALR